MEPHDQVDTDARDGDGADLFDKVVNLCTRRGFVFRSAEIYGGFRSAYDYGPLGVLMLRNVKQAWWRSMVQLRDDVVGLDASILSPPAVWEASGHLANFTDPLVDCTSCRERFRQDQLDDPDLCPSCGKRGTFTEARQFNLMFKTHAGPVEGEGAVVYLRPETAQGMFVNFANVVRTSRKRPPFGIAQIGKSFRNEITPQNFVFRTREFEQMELEYFVPPDDGPRWHEYWLAERFAWYLDLGIPEAKLRLRAHDADELSHYSAGTSDVEFLFPWGWGELEGIANRTDYDLRQHGEHSGQKLEYFDQATGERYVPHVIEPAAGATRSMMAFLIAAYDEEVVGATATATCAPCCASTTASPPTRSPCCPCPGRRRSRRWPGRSSAWCSRTSWSTTTRRRPSAVATGARTRSARRTASPSTSTRSTTAPSPSGTATPWARSGSPSTTSWPTSRAAWPEWDPPWRRAAPTTGPASTGSVRSSTGRQRRRPPSSAPRGRASSR